MFPVRTAVPARACRTMPVAAVTTVEQTWAWRGGRLPTGRRPVLSGHHACRDRPPRDHRAQDLDRHERLPAPARRHPGLPAQHGAAPGPHPGRRLRLDLEAQRGGARGHRRLRRRAAVPGDPGPYDDAAADPAGDPAGHRAAARTRLLLGLVRGGGAARADGARAPFGGARRIVATTHGHEAGWAQPAARQLLRRIGTGTDTLTYLGEYTRSRIAGALTPEAAARMVQLPPGVDEKTFHPGSGGDAVRARLGLTGRPVVVCLAAGPAQGPGHPDRGDAG